jgi:PAS domain S-box-containing protein
MDALDKIAELNAKQAETRIDAPTWQEIFDVAPDGMIVIDRRARILAANRQVVYMFGYPALELIGKPVHMLLAPELAERHAKHIANFFRNPTARPMEAGRHLPGLTSDGESVTVQISIAPVIYYAGVLGVAMIRRIASGG